MCDIGASFYQSTLPGLPRYVVLYYLSTDYMISYCIMFKKKGEASFEAVIKLSAVSSWHEFRDIGR